MSSVISKHKDLCYYWLVRLVPVLWGICRSFLGRPPSKCASWRCEKEAFARHLLQSLQVEVLQRKPSCETSVNSCKLKLWIWRCRARLASNTASWSCENTVFVRDFLPKHLFAVTLLWSRCYFLQSLFCCSNLSLRSFFLQYFNSEI